MTYETDYKIIHHKADLGEKTTYIEIGPGKYQGGHFREGFIFVDDEAFICAEGTILKHFKKHDHYDMNTISKKIGFQIVKDWRLAAHQVLQVDKSGLKDVLRIQDTVNEYYENRLHEEREKISHMLNEVADFVESILKSNSSFCILGI